MGSEVLSERIEWESHRVAAAFGAPWSFVAEFLPESGASGTLFRFRSWNVMLAADTRLVFTFRQYKGALTWSQVCLYRGGDEQWCDLQSTLSDEDTWTCWTLTSTGGLNELMMRALYCLNFEEEGVFQKLNSPLSAHEKMELRLSMPREFWPHKWHEEESA